MYVYIYIYKYVHSIMFPLFLLLYRKDLPLPILPLPSLCLLFRFSIETTTDCVNNPNKHLLVNDPRNGTSMRKISPPIPPRRLARIPYCPVSRAGPASQWSLNHRIFDRFASPLTSSFHGPSFIPTAPSIFYCPLYSTYPSWPPNTTFLGST